MTAHQGNGLSASARLVVNVGAISYGPSPVVLLEVPDKEFTVVSRKYNILSKEE